MKISAQRLDLQTAGKAGQMLGMGANIGNRKAAARLRRIQAPGDLVRLIG